MSKAFFGGLPTALDLRRLAEAFPQIEEGDEITHEEVAEVLEVDQTGNRYRTVTNAWRKQLLNEHNVELGALPGIGFRSLTPSERVSGGVKGVQSGTRKQLRSVRRVALVRTEDEQLRNKQHLLMRYGAALQSMASTMIKEIEFPKPPEQMPRVITMQDEHGRRRDAGV